MHFSTQRPPKNFGFSLMEILGVIAVVMLLVILALPSYKDMHLGAKEAVSTRNAETLNSAVHQYDQAGGLMTAQVTVPQNVKDIKDPSALPEMKVLSLLRDANQNASGELISSWQSPVFSDTGYRTIWVNDFPESLAAETTASVSGVRNPMAEDFVEKGRGGRFIVVGPQEQEGRLGIVSFEEKELTEETPPIANSLSPQTYMVDVTLSDVSAGTISGNGQYTEGAVAELEVKLNPGWEIEKWDTTVQPTFSTSERGRFTVVGDVYGSLILARSRLQVDLRIEPPNAGTVSGSGTYNYGENVTYSINANPGWELQNWSEPGLQTTGSINNLQNNFVATAFMRPTSQPTTSITLLPSGGGSATISTVVNGTNLAVTNSGTIQAAIGGSLAFAAYPDANFTFSHWTNSGVASTSANAGTTSIPNSAATLRPVFLPPTGAPQVWGSVYPPVAWQGRTFQVTANVTSSEQPAQLEWVFPPETISANSETISTFPGETKTFTAHRPQTASTRIIRGQNPDARTDQNLELKLVSQSASGVRTTNSVNFATTAIPQLYFSDIPRANFDSRTNTGTGTFPYLYLFWNNASMQYNANLGGSDITIPTTEGEQITTKVYLDRPPIFGDVPVNISVTGGGNTSTDKITFNMSNWNTGIPITFQNPEDSNVDDELGRIAVSAPDLGQNIAYSLQTTDNDTLLTIETNPTGAGTVNMASGIYPRNATLTLEATPASGNYFKEWFHTAYSYTPILSGRPDLNTTAIRLAHPRVTVRAEFSDELPPPVPSLVFSQITCEGFTAYWNPVQDATRYQVDVSTTQNFSDRTTFYPSVSERGAGTSAAVYPVPPATTYYVRVRAGNTGGWGPYSSPRAVTTLGGTEPTTPLTPEGLNIALAEYTGIMSSGAHRSQLGIVMNAQQWNSVKNDPLMKGIEVQIVNSDTGVVAYQGSPYLRGEFSRRDPNTGQPLYSASGNPYLGSSTLDWPTQPANTLALYYSWLESQNLFVRARFVYDCGFGPWAYTPNLEAILCAKAGTVANPQVVSAVWPTNGAQAHLNVRWDALQNATRYELGTITRTNGGAWVTNGTVIVSGTIFGTNLTPPVTTRTLGISFGEEAKFRIRGTVAPIQNASISESCWGPWSESTNTGGPVSCPPLTIQGSPTNVVSSTPALTAAGYVSSISWAPVSGATLYAVQLRTNQTVASQTIATGTTNIGINNLIPGMTYYPVVAVQNGCSVSTNTTFGAPFTVPNCPSLSLNISNITVLTKLDASNLGGMYTDRFVRFEAPDDHRNFQATAVLIPEGTVAEQRNTTSKLVQFRTLAPTRTYRIDIRANNGCSALSAPVSVTSDPIYPPPPVGTPDITAINRDSFTFSWLPVVGASEYAFDVGLDSSFATFLAGFNGLRTSSTAVSVTGLTPNTTYYVRVRAINSSGASENSQVVVITTSR